MAQKHENDTRGPPEATFGHEMARSGVFGGVGGSAWRRIAGARCSRGSSVGTGVQGVVGEQGNAWVLTGPLKREERRCRGVEGEDRRRVAGGARGRAAVEVGAESSGLGEVPGVEAESREEEAAARLCNGARAEMEGGGG